MKVRKWWSSSHFSVTSVIIFHSLNNQEVNQPELHRQKMTKITAFYSKIAAKLSYQSKTLIISSLNDKTEGCLSFIILRMEGMKWTLCINVKQWLAKFGIEKLRMSHDWLNFVDKTENMEWKDKFCWQKLRFQCILTDWTLPRKLRIIP